MIYLSQILIPLPKSMHWIALFSPAYHLEQTGLAAIGAASEGALAVHMPVLIGVTVAFTVFAVRMIQRRG